MTSDVPIKSERGRLRCGFFTSAATKVMSCHESAENNEPACEMQMAINSPNVLAQGKYQTRSALHLSPSLHRKPAETTTPDESEDGVRRGLIVHIR